MRNVVKNLNYKNVGIIFSKNSKSFAQVMKMYGGRRMCDLFSLNYCNTSYSIIKHDARMGVNFVPGKHTSIFAAIASIYNM